MPGENGQDHILFWEEDEIESLLKGSVAYDEAKTFRKEVCKHEFFLKLSRAYCMIMLGLISIKCKRLTLQ